MEGRLLKPNSGNEIVYIHVLEPERRFTHVCHKFIRNVNANGTQIHYKLRIILHITNPLLLQTIYRLFYTHKFSVFLLLKLYTRSIGQATYVAYYYKLDIL